MSTMEFTGAIRPGTYPWTGSWPGQLVSVRICYENLASGWLEVGPLDPSTEAVDEYQHTSAFSSPDEMHDVIRWCDHHFDFDQEQVLRAWDQALGPECPICLEPITPDETPHRCSECPQQFHAQCFLRCTRCPVCRQ